jgi:hypothetical protein
MTSRQDVQKRRVWETRLERFRTSGLTVARFCAQEGVSANTFYYWARRVGVAATSVRTSVSQRGGTVKRGRPSPQPLSAAGENTPAGLVRFHWNAGVEVSVPAECLDAIRCLAKCLPHGQVERTDAFQELVVSS